MKKLITLLSFVLVITVVKAQQPTPTTDQTQVQTTPATDTTTTATTSTTNDKQCHGVTKACPIPCTDKEMKKCKGKSKDCCAGHDAKTSASTTTSSESLSAEQVNNGAVQVATPDESKKKQCAGKNGKSCCQGASKASAVNTVPQAQPANDTPQGDSPK
ncbi:MAG TPA: hypothetical protein VE978_14795 [Chitinophagales bacterium]|nr:hypothetical protein [Chitinophagales bacterium]